MRYIITLFILLSFMLGVCDMSDEITDKDFEEWSKSFESTVDKWESEDEEQPEIWVRIDLISSFDKLKQEVAQRINAIYQDKDVLYAIIYALLLITFFLTLLCASLMSQGKKIEKSLLYLNKQITGLIDQINSLEDEMCE